MTATKTTSQNYSVTEDGYVTQNSTGINPKVSLDTAYGTNITLASTHIVGKNYNPDFSLNVVQPLMRGFGRPIVENELNNARDSRKINYLNMEENLRDTVTQVIDAYLDFISNQKTLQMDLNALKSAQRLVEQTNLFIKAGHKAGVELVTAETSVASSETKIESDKNQLAQSRSQLLQTIGLDPASEVIFNGLNIPLLIKKYHIPTLTDTKKWVIANDVGYQTAQITLNGMTKRSLLIAEDNTRWKLDLTANGKIGGSSGGGRNAGINSLVNGVNRNDLLQLDLTIPIDDKGAKIAVENAKLSLREAEIGFKQLKWQKETTAINNWNNIFSAERALHLSGHEVELQQKSYSVFEQKYNYGLIDSLELQSARQAYLSSQQGFIGTQISYLKALVALDQLIGHTLQTWDVQVNYG